jgi:hypothetical protein
MNTMSKSLAVLAAAAALLSCPPVHAGDHLATADAVQARLLQSSAQRAQDLATVDAALATPLAREAAGAVGADLDRLRAGVPSLSDAELSDLAARAGALQSDPVAGMDRQMRMLVMIALILVIIVLLLAIL